MKLDKTLYPAQVIERLTRFTARVEVEGEEKYLYVPNSGRLKELIFPGAGVFVALANDRAKDRRTAGEIVYAHTPEGAKSSSGLVSINSHLANALAEEALREGIYLPWLQCYPGKGSTPGKTAALISCCSFLRDLV